MSLRSYIWIPSTHLLKTFAKIVFLGSELGGYRFLEPPWTFLVALSEHQDGFKGNARGVHCLNLRNFMNYCLILSIFVKLSYFTPIEQIISLFHRVSPSDKIYEFVPALLSMKNDLCKCDFESLMIIYQREPKITENWNCDERWHDGEIDGSIHHICPHVRYVCPPSNVIVGLAKDP